MKKIRELSVAQVRLFPVDTIPQILPLYSILAEAIGKTFRFQGYEEGEPMPGLAGLPFPPFIPGQSPSLNFQGGRFPVDDSRFIFINSLSIEGRRVILNVSGTSEQANEVYESVKSVIIAVWPASEIGFSEVVYEVDETTCIVDLDLDFTSLFRTELLSFLEGSLTDVMSDQRVGANVQVSGLKVKVSYQIEDSNISGHGITLNNKEFTIEPRISTPSDARIYYTKSPLPTHKHLAVLEELEALFKA